jgi:hypothetical protein
MSGPWVVSVSVIITLRRGRFNRVLVSWMYAHFVERSVAATENLKKDIKVKTDKFVEHALIFRRTLLVLKFGSATSIISGCLFLVFHT